VKTTGLHSPFIDGEVLGAAPPLRSPFEQVMAEPKAAPMPATAAAGVRVVDAKGDPLSGVAWSLHQGSLVLRGTLVAGEADVLAQGAKSFDRSKPFRFHVEGHVCSIVSGAALLVDEPGVEYGGTLFDWHAADSADPAVRSAFWKDYAARRQQNASPSVFRFIQHDHIVRRPVRWLKGTNLVVLQAQSPAIRLGPLVRHTDDSQARIWLELDAPSLVRVIYGAAPQANRKPMSTDVPANPRTRHACSVRVGGRHFAMLTLDGLPPGAVVQYTVELAPQPPTSPLPDAEAQFTEAAFPRSLPTGVIQAQQAALKQIAFGRSPSHWLYLRTLPRGGENLRFAHGSCRDYPNDQNENGKFPGEDMLDRFAAAFLDARELEEWPHFFMHTGDQIYADDVGKLLGGQFVRQRFAAVTPGPKSGDDLLRGAWAGRFALRHVARTLQLPSPPKSNLDAVKRQRLSYHNAFQIEGYIERADTALRRQAVHPAFGAPPAQKLQVLNHLLWQVPVAAADMPQVDPRRGLLMPQVFRVKDPDARDLRLAHPSAGDVGGIHAADFAEYAALYEQAWTVHDARRALAHLPSYMIFDDHEVTDDWNAGPSWLARVHDGSDKLRMWPTTMTDALAAYWLYQGWGNLSPKAAASDDRVLILERARKGGHDALPELRRMIHDRAVLPTRKGVDRSRLLAWNYAVPAGATPFLVVDLRTDRDVHGKGGMSKKRVDWLESALRATRTPSAVIVLPVPMLLPAPVLFAMRNPGIPTVMTGAPSTEAFKLGSDIEHPATNLVWEQMKGLLQRLQQAGSTIKTLVLVSGDIHFSCNLEAQVPGAKAAPRLLQLVSSGLRNTIDKGKREKMESAYTGWLNLISGSRGVDEHRGMVITLGGLEGPGGKLSNFLYPTSVALVDVRTVVGSPRGKNFGRMALIHQTHFIAGPNGTLLPYEFRHLTRDGSSALMTLHDPGPPNPDRPSGYPRGKDALGLVHELELEEERPEAEDFELRHDGDEAQAEPTLEVFQAQEEPQDEQAQWGDETEDEHAFDDEESGLEPESVPETEDEIIGADQRVLVADPLDVPHRWICALDVYFDTSSLPRGTKIHDHTRATGVLIGPRHVLTARHVIEPTPITVDGTAYTPPVTRIRVTPGRCGDNRKPPVADAWMKDKLAASAFQLLPPGQTSGRGTRIHPDYALLVLDRDLAAAPHKRFKRLGYWGEDPALAELRVVDLDRAPASDVTVAGYPGDTCGKIILLRKERAAGKASEADVDRAVKKTQRNEAHLWASRMWHASGPATVQKRFETLHYAVDTFSAQSGAPVFQKSGGVWQLLAVHNRPGSVGADSNAVVDNEGSAVTGRMLRELCGWINKDAGRQIASIKQDRLVFDSAPAPAHEFEDAETADAFGDELEHDHEEDHGADEGEFDGEVPRAAGVANTASRVDRGLKLAETWLRRQPRSGIPELLRFAVSLLRTHFFPSGHGVIDAAGQVQKQAPAAHVAMKLRLHDGSQVPFEHRVRLWLSARGADSAVTAGRHSDALFSSITLYAPALAGAAPTVALQHAVHEVLHMLFTLLDRLRRRHGDAMADAFLQKDPWKLLDLRRYATWRDRLQQALGPLMHLLGSPEPAADAANRLVEETFAATLAMHLRFTLERGSKSGIVASSMTEDLVRHYVLDHSPRLSSLLGTTELAQASAPLKPIFDELQQAMNATWQGRAAPALQPEALFEPF